MHPQSPKEAYTLFQQNFSATSWRGLPPTERIKWERLHAAYTSKTIHSTRLGVYLLIPSIGAGTGIYFMLVFGFTWADVIPGAFIGAFLSCLFVAYLIHRRV